MVTADLRADWPALGAADSTRPSPPRGSAEGLLRYLPAGAQDRLLDNVTALQCADSRFATESIRNFKPHHEERMRERMTIRHRWRAYGFDLDMNELRTSATATSPPRTYPTMVKLTEIKSQDC